MADFFRRALTRLRDTLSGRRRFARYTDPEAHRRGPAIRPSRTLENYRPHDTGGGPF